MRNLTGTPFWRTFVIGAVAAAAGNTAIYVAARAAGVGFVVASANSSTTVPYAQVAIMSVIPVLVGAVVLRLADPRARLVEAIAVIITLLSLGAPLTMASDTATAAALAVMHVVAGAVFTNAAKTTYRYSFVVARRRQRVSNTGEPGSLTIAERPVRRRRFPDGPRPSISTKRRIMHLSTTDDSSLLVVGLGGSLEHPSVGASVPRHDQRGVQERARLAPTARTARAPVPVRQARWANRHRRRRASAPSGELDGVHRAGAAWMDRPARRAISHARRALAGETIGTDAQRQLEALAGEVVRAAARLGCGDTDRQSTNGRRAA